MIFQKCMAMNFQNGMAAIFQKVYGKNDRVVIKFFYMTEKSIILFIKGVYENEW